MSDSTTTTTGPAATVSGGQEAAAGAAAPSTSGGGVVSSLLGVDLSNWFERGFLILIGLLIVGFGLWHLFTSPSPSPPQTGVST